MHFCFISRRLPSYCLYLCLSLVHLHCQRHSDRNETYIDDSVPVILISPFRYPHPTETACQGSAACRLYALFYSVDLGRYTFTAPAHGDLHF
jgi:hypothetical protein